MSILNEPDATPLELLEHMKEHHDKDWLSWEPETLWQVLEIDCYEHCIYNKNKLQALQVVLNNDLFWKDWMTFEKVTLAFNSVPPRFDAIEEVTPAMMGYAVVTAKNARRVPGMNTPGKDPVFNQEVKYYTAIRSYLEGFIYLPDPLEYAQKNLNRLTGMSKLAEEIKIKSNDPDFEVIEDPVSVGAIRALIVKSYSYSKKRKNIE